LFQEKSAIFPSFKDSEYYSEDLEDCLFSMFDLATGIRISKNTIAYKDGERICTCPTYINLSDTRILLGMSFTDRETSTTVHAELFGRYGSDCVLKNDSD
jgi:hypothetical protein